MDNVNKIVLKGKGHYEEGEADSAITPGQAVELAADGKYDQVQSSQAEGIKGGFKVAYEDSLQGNTITDAYAQGDRVFIYEPLPGDHIHVLVKSGEDIDVGDEGIVEGGGSGLFVESAGTEAEYKVEFLEDSGGALAANTHLKARVL